MKISRATRNRINPLIVELRTDNISVGKAGVSIGQPKSDKILVRERHQAADALETLLGTGNGK